MVFDAVVDVDVVDVVVDVVVDAAVNVVVDFDVDVFVNAVVVVAVNVVVNDVVNAIVNVVEDDVSYVVPDEIVEVAEVALSNVVASIECVWSQILRSSQYLLCFRSGAHNLSNLRSLQFRDNVFIAASANGTKFHVIFNTW